ncbi:type IV secretory system conjugative DNA transfer family protein [Bradyrhizobium jicamae]|uniref:type IV secretory system conjugative DNA transfer family protein n=1 Tax=Bradyrhizobium jicamae TaxID=280332 RepID=UPI00289ED331|nr:type IV secretory system conjugative DNA transfer family protein [Bradyrhizobium jicamae]
MRNAERDPRRYLIHTFQTCPEICDLRRKPFTVFISAPVSDFGTVEPIIRLFIQQVHDVLLRQPPGKDETMGRSPASNRRSIARRQTAIRKAIEYTIATTSLGMAAV